MAEGFVIVDGLGPDDIPAVMAIERLPGYETLVGRWEAPRHYAELADPGSRYFGLADGDGLAGFAIVLGLDDPNKRAHLKRIAVADPGRGAGTVLLTGLIDALFLCTDINRLDLDVFVENGRAKRAYERAGFTAEGVMREHHATADGFRDVWLMSILRREWQGTVTLTVPGDS